MIFVDSNVFVTALRYPRDRKARANAALLACILDRGDAVTSVVNLLEVCGILSFDLSERQLRALYGHFAQRFGVRVLPHDRDGRAVLPATPAEILTLMAGRMSLGDALVAHALPRWAPAAESFVSWDARALLLGEAMETSASCEARSAPSLYPTAPGVRAAARASPPAQRATQTHLRRSAVGDPDHHPRSSRHPSLDLRTNAPRITPDAPPRRAVKHPRNSCSVKCGSKS